jgi:hypothetical protein
MKTKKEFVEYLRYEVINNRINTRCDVVKTLDDLLYSKMIFLLL